MEVRESKGDKGGACTLRVSCHYFCVFDRGALVPFLATFRSTTSCYLGESAPLHFDYITTSSGYLSSTPPLHLDRVRAAISVNLQPAAVTRKIGGTVAHLRRCMGRRTSARGTSGIEVELILGTSRGASAGDVWWYKT